MVVIGPESFDILIALEIQIHKPSIKYLVCACLANLLIEFNELLVGCKSGRE